MVSVIKIIKEKSEFNSIQRHGDFGDALITEK